MDMQLASCFSSFLLVETQDKFCVASKYPHNQTMSLSHFETTIVRRGGPGQYAEGFWIVKEENSETISLLRLISLSVWKGSQSTLSLPEDLQNSTSEISTLSFLHMLMHNLALKSHKSVYVLYSDSNWLCQGDSFSGTFWNLGSDLCRCDEFCWGCCCCIVMLLVQMGGQECMAFWSGSIHCTRVR